MSTSALIRPNVTIRDVERRSGLDRYGQGAYNKLPTHNIRARLERATRTVRNLQGDTSTVDATLMVGPALALEEGDRVTLTDDSVYEIFGIDESQDILGATKFTQYTCTRQRKTDG